MARRAAPADLPLAPEEEVLATRTLEVSESDQPSDVIRSVAGTGDHKVEDAPGPMPATIGPNVTLSAPLGADGQSRGAKVTLEAGERLVAVGLESEAQIYRTDRGRAFAVAADGTVTIREEG